MNEYTQEQFDQVPEFMQADYVKDGEVYKHAGVMKMKGTLNDLNGKVNSLEKSKQDELLAVKEQYDIELADKLEKAHKDNDSGEILRIEREKLDDEKRRLELSSTEFSDRMQVIASNQEKSIAKSLSSEIATTKGKLAFEKLIASYIKVDPMTGLETFLNDDGSASSLNREQFAIEVKKNELFASLVKADINVDGGGNINGGNKASGGKDPKQMSSKERIEFKQRDPEGFKRAFKLN